MGGEISGDLGLEKSGASGCTGSPSELCTGVRSGEALDTNTVGEDSKPGGRVMSMRELGEARLEGASHPSASRALAAVAVAGSELALGGDEEGSTEVG